MPSLRKNPKAIFRKSFRSSSDHDFLRRYSAERFQTYRNHIHYGIFDNLRSGFPVIRSLLSEKEWASLLDRFYLKRLTRSPIARRVLREFSVYLQKNYRGPLLKKFPYLRELAEYENVDVTLFFQEDLNVSAPMKSSHPLQIRPVLNPHVLSRVYHWPVHKICVKHSSLRTVKKGVYPLIVYRHPETLSVKFLESNPLVHEMIEELHKKPTIERLLKTLTKRHAVAADQRESFFEEAIRTLTYLKEKGVILHLQ